MSKQKLTSSQKLLDVVLSDLLFSVEQPQFINTLIKMPNICWLQLLRCLDLVLFVIHEKVNKETVLCVVLAAAEAENFSVGPDEQFFQHIDILQINQW